MTVYLFIHFCKISDSYIFILFSDNIPEYSYISLYVQICSMKATYFSVVVEKYYLRGKRLMNIYGESKLKNHTFKQASWLNFPGLLTTPVCLSSQRIAPIFFLGEIQKVDLSE